MKHEARPHPESDRHLLYPFCDTPVDGAAADRLSRGRGAEWTADASGAAVFDDSRKAGGRRPARRGRKPAADR